MTKNEIISEIRGQLTAKSATLSGMIDEIRTGLASESKSSAGDKYETSRAMAQQELEKLATQQQEVKRQISLLATVPGEPLQSIQSGSLVGTDRSLFFIGVPAGKIEIGDQHIYCLGVTAPLAQRLFGKKKGEELKIGEETHRIMNIG